MSGAAEIAKVAEWLRDLRGEAKRIKRRGAQRAEARAREQNMVVVSDADSVYVRPRRGTSLAPIAVEMGKGMVEEFGRSKR